MTFLSEVIKGIGFALGFFIVLGVIIVVLYKVFLDDSDDYEVKELLDAFKIYEKGITDDERYEEIKEVQEIIKKLETGTIPDAVENYEIKTESSLIIDEEGEDKQVIRWKEHYTILHKIEEPSKSKN